MAIVFCSHCFRGNSQLTFKIDVECVLKMNLSHSFRHISYVFCERFPRIRRPCRFLVCSSRRRGAARRAPATPWTSYAFPAASDVLSCSGAKNSCVLQWVTNWNTKIPFGFFLNKNGYEHKTETPKRIFMNFIPKSMMLNLNENKFNTKFFTQFSIILG